MDSSPPRLYPILLGLSFILGISSPAKAEPIQSKAAVWRVQSPTSTLYLAGSVHLLRAEDHPLPSAYDEAYADAERLYFEVDLGDSMNLEKQVGLLGIGRYPAGETIRDHVGEETIELLDAYLDALGIGRVIFESMKPGMLALTIASMEYLKLGALPQLGVDYHFYMRAVKDGKAVDGFETSEFQLNLFDKLAPDQQERMLRETLENLEESEKVSRDLIAAWRSGDIEAMAEILAQQVSEDRAIAKVLLFDRNRSWMGEIESLLRGSENAMVVVGAGHLVGSKSVVDLLEKRGYTVEQLGVEAGGDGVTR
ncbi:MAG: TraB/GumN family protein [Verrucomicrobiales bacterium]